MNTLLILDHDAEIYETELRKKDLPDLDIVIAPDLIAAAPSLPGAEIIFGTPALVAEVVDKATRLKWVQLDLI